MSNRFRTRTHARAKQGSALRVQTRNRNVRSGLERLESRQLLALSIANLPAEDVTFESASIGVDVSEADTNPTVSIYWGDKDAGTEAVEWASVLDLGVIAEGQHAATIDGLVPGTEYFYRAFAFSFSDGTIWTDSTQSFTTDTLPLPNVELAPNLLVGDSSVVVNGAIDGMATLESAAIYYGLEDGGRDPDAWLQTIAIPAEDDAFTAILSDLVPGTDYYYRLVATNAGGSTWSEPKQVTTEAIAPIRISEVMAANASTLPTRVRLNADDRFAGPRNSFDWIEIQNASSSPFDLGGFYLSDSMDQPLKWQVPENTVIAPHESMVVLASGKDVRDADLDELGLLHTNFALKADGEYLSLTNPEGAYVQQIDATSTANYSDVSVGYFGNTFGTLQLASPGLPNAPLAPVMSEPVHDFVRPADATSPLVVTAQIEASQVGETDVQLAYRAMFEDEFTVAMSDDGLGHDQTAGDGLFTGVIPGELAQPGEMLRYAIVATSDSGVVSRMPRFLSDDNSPEYFGTIVDDAQIDTAVPVFHRFIEDSRRAETGSGTRATVYFNGELYDNVFIRIRGGTARS